MHADPDVARRLELLAHAVETSPHNLVSARAVEEVRTRHIPECVELAGTLPSGGGTLLDVGSGGGFPGLVIAAARPDLRVTLLDATRKKTVFLAETAHAMDLDVEVVNGRAEELARERGGSYDLVTARAVAPLHRLVGWTVPFLTPDGAVYAVKGERWAEEVEEARPELARHRARITATPSPEAPRDGLKVVIIRRAP